MKFLPVEITIVLYKKLFLNDFLAAQVNLCAIHLFIYLLQPHKMILITYKGKPHTDQTVQIISLGWKETEMLMWVFPVPKGWLLWRNYQLVPFLKKDTDNFTLFLTISSRVSTYVPLHFSSTLADWSFSFSSFYSFQFVNNGRIKNRNVKREQTREEERELDN